MLVLKIAESVQFDLKTIEAATSNFSASNKLGQGGFGEVYKVTSFSSFVEKQWNDDALFVSRINGFNKIPLLFKHF